jgi:hypothetical protein
MRVFVFHEFHNDTGNTDVFDTISSHSGSVFTPFYLSKPQRDAQGYGFVTLVQVAPYDVVSRHAANFGNRGPGIEVAKNRGDALSAIQAKAGIVLATMISHAVPHIRMVHHRGVEGLAMLRAYQQRRNSLSDRFVRLPFLSAPKHFLPLAGAQLSVLLDLAERKPMNLRSGLTPPSPQLISTGWHRSAVGSSSERWFLPAARQAYDPIGDLIRSLDEQRAAPPMPSGR